MSRDYVIFRMQKLKRGSGGGSLSRAIKHLERHAVSAEISHPERTAENAMKIRPEFSCSRLPATMKKVLDTHRKATGKALRKDAAVAVEMLFSYSPDTEGISHEEYEKRLLSFVKKNFPCIQIVAMARHCDEESVHWHLIAIPYKDKEHTVISARNALGGPQDLQRYQSAIADEMADLGLKRGISKRITKSTHKTKAEHNRQQIARQKETQKEAQKALLEIDLF